MVHVDISRLDLLVLGRPRPPIFTTRRTQSTINVIFENEFVARKSEDVKTFEKKFL